MEGSRTKFEMERQEVGRGWQKKGTHIPSWKKGGEA